MRDVKLVTVTDAEDVSYLDIDIINGEPVWLEEEAQTNDQRAAVACFICKGSVPGLPDLGVSWANVYSRESTTMQLNNELSQQIQDYVATASDTNMLTQSSYTPILLEDSGGIGVLIYRGGQ